MGNWLKIGVLIAICLIPLFIAPAFASSSLYTKINPEEPTSYFEIVFQRTVFIEYDEGGIFAGILSDRSWEIRVSADSSNSGVKDLQNKLNQKILSDGSIVKVSDLNVNYTATLEGRGLYAAIDYIIILSGKLSNYVIIENEERTILDLGWRGMTVYEPVVINGAEINFPISAIKEKEAYVYNNIVGTEAEDLLSEPLMNAESIKDKPLTTWNFLVNPDLTFSTFTIDKTRIERVKNAAFTVDKSYNVKSIESHDSANLQVFGFAAVDNLEGREILGVTPTAPEVYTSKEESARTESSNGFDYDLYDGFYIEYGKCNLTTEASLELLEIMINQLVKELLEESFCVLVENSVFEFDKITSEGVLTTKYKFSENFGPVTFFNSGYFDGLPIVLPNDWEVGDSLRYSLGTITSLDYNGIKQKTINEQQIDVYEFVGEDFADNDGTLAQYGVNLQYDKKSGFLVDSFIDIKVANVFGSASIELVMEAIDISKPPLRVILPSNGGGCLIATATYGSELAPQVQMLREIRDNSLLQTQSGQSFMEGFNSFYYSFSPTIADYERQNPVFKEAVKVTITPLLASLSLLNYVDLDSEESVLGYGIGIILMNVGMYFVAPAIIIHRIKKYV